MTGLVWSLIVGGAVAIVVDVIADVRRIRRDRHEHARDAARRRRALLAELDRHPGGPT